MPNLLLTMWDTIKSSNIGILVAAGLGLSLIHISEPTRP